MITYRKLKKEEKQSRYFNMKARCGKEYQDPNTGKYVQKKFVRIGEGSITYSIGHHRFIEMARAAGAVYKINEGTGGTVLVNLEIFDEYMEQPF